MLSATNWEGLEAIMEFDVDESGDPQTPPLTDNELTMLKAMAVLESAKEIHKENDNIMTIIEQNSR